MDKRTYSITISDISTIIIKSNDNKDFYIVWHKYYKNDNDSYVLIRDEYKEFESKLIDICSNFLEQHIQHEIFIQQKQSDELIDKDNVFIKEDVKYYVTILDNDTVYIHNSDIDFSCMKLKNGQFVGLQCHYNENSNEYNRLQYKLINISDIFLEL